MATIRMKLPIDLSLTNMLLYEGLLYLLAEGPSKDFNLLPAIDDGFLVQARFDDGFLVQVFDKIYRKMENSQKNKFIDDVELTSNDTRNAKKDKRKSMLIKLLEKYNILEEFQKRRPPKRYFSIGDLIYVFSKNIKNISLANVIYISMNIDKDVVYYGSNSKEDVVSLQLFKVDRYTGFSSTEAHYTSKQLTSRFSMEVFVIALLGLYSSIVMSKNDKYYFMFFSPSETIYILSKGDRNVLRSYWNIKQKVGEIVSKAFKTARSNEVMMLEVMLNVELHDLLVREDINRVSLVLFRVDREGRTYKIYELIPLTVYRDTLFHRKIEEYFDYPERVMHSVRDFLRSGHILTALENREREDTSNVLVALQSIYRFIILGDIQAWYSFVRELSNAKKKLESESPKSKRELEKRNELLESYRRLLSRLPGANTYAG